MKKIDELKEVMSQREEGYGGSERTLRKIGLMWSAWLNMRFGPRHDLSPTDVAELMVLLKVARSSGLPSVRVGDDRLDMAGYSILASEMAELDSVPTEHLEAF